MFIYIFRLGHINLMSTQTTKANNKRLSVESYQFNEKFLWTSIFDDLVDSPAYRDDVM